MNTKLTNKKRATFSNENGVSKEVARLRIVSAILAYKTNNRKVLSLPADNCYIEKKLLEKQKKIDFVMCECVKTTYSNLLDMIKTLSRFPSSLVFGEIGETIRKAKENDYNDLILDYCGQIGTFADEITYAIKNKIVTVNGTISMTFNKRISIGDSMKFIEKMERVTPNAKHEEGDNRTEPAISTFIRGVCGFDYELVETLPYKDVKKAAMILVIIRRIA